jgi:hypothetical protein
MTVCGTATFLNLFRNRIGAPASGTATFLNLFRNRIERRPPARGRCETRGVKLVFADSMKSISLDTLVRETR